MDTQSAWGIMILVHVLIGGFFVSNEEQTIEAREGLYPEREHAEWEKNRPNISIVWMLGLFIILGGYSAGLTFELTAVAWLALLPIWAFMRYLGRRIKPMQNRKFRIWLAGSFAWIMTAGVAYLIISSLSYVSSSEVIGYLYLATLPPMVAGLSFLVLQWAKKV